MADQHIYPDGRKDQDDHERVGGDRRDSVVAAIVWIAGAVKQRAPCEVKELTAGELFEALKDMPPHWPIIVSGDGRKILRIDAKVGQWCVRLKQSDGTFEHTNSVVLFIESEEVDDGKRRNRYDQ